MLQYAHVDFVSVKGKSKSISLNYSKKNDCKFETKLHDTKKKQKYYIQWTEEKVKKKKHNIKLKPNTKKLNIHIKINTWSKMLNIFFFKKKFKSNRYIRIVLLYLFH